MLFAWPLMWISISLAKFLWEISFRPHLTLPFWLHLILKFLLHFTPEFRFYLFIEFKLHFFFEFWQHSFFEFRLYLFFEFWLHLFFEFRLYLFFEFRLHLFFEFRLHVPRISILFYIPGRLTLQRVLESDVAENGMSVRVSLFMWPPNIYVLQMRFIKHLWLIVKFGYSCWTRPGQRRVLCNQLRLSVCPSVRPSVRPSVCLSVTRVLILPIIRFFWFFASS